MRIYQFITALLPLCAAAMEIESVKFASEGDLTGWAVSPSNAAIISDGALKVTNPVRSENSRAEIVKSLPLGKVAGRRVWASVEMSQDLTPSVSKWGGKVFLLEGGMKGHYVYAGKYVAPGKSGWGKVSFFADVPLESDALRIHLGAESSSGSAMFRNLKIESSDIFAEFAKIANAGYAEKDFELKAFGAFSPAGVGYGASEFDAGKTEYAKVPFSMRRFHRNGKKFAVAMKSKNFPSGLERAEAEFPNISAEGKFLYALHFVSGSADGEKIGIVEIFGENGKKAAFAIETGKNVFDYARPSANAECVSASPWQKRGSIYAACVSKFPIPENFGRIAKIAFSPAAAAAGTWIVLAANISERDAAFPKEWNYTARAGGVWKPLPEKYAPPAAAGSVLDLSSLNPKETAGDRGRVIINKNGRLAFEKTPDVPAKFLIHIGGDFREMSNPREAAAYAAKLRQNGYNMVRLSPDRDLMSGAPADGEFNRERLDLLFRYIAELKKNGIYIEFDAMASGIGYSVGDSWDPRERRNFKYSIYWDENVKKNWLLGTRKILAETNPYTGTKLAEDPQLALVIGYNELEFGLTHNSGYGELRDQWIKFLKRKYRNRFEKLAEAWGKEAAGGAKDFGDLPAFTHADAYGRLDQRARDANEFCMKLERDILKWFRRQFRAMGFEGPVTNFNMGKSLRSALSRKNADYVAMNNYHAHPSNFITLGSRISQESSVGEAINISRAFSATKMRGKPYVITEHGHVFWNKYRYEQGFATGAHSALQGFDGITCFANPVTMKDTPPAVYPFNNAPDATIRSQEFLTALMYLRGDVAESKSEAVVRVDEKDVYKTYSYNYGLDARQSRLCLLTKMSLALSKFEPAENEIAFDRLGGSSLILHTAYGNIADTQHSDFDLKSAVDQMRGRGMLSKSNRTDVDKGIFESSTDEIYIDTARKLMTVDTPRLQGSSAPAGTGAKLSDFEIISAQRSANITVAAVDGLKPIREARRLALVISTNSLNSGMTFDDAEMTGLIDIGKPPLLVETGRFKVALSTPRWKAMRLWALNMDGTRLKEIPLKKSEGRIEAEIDTSSLPIPSVFFELSAAE